MGGREEEGEQGKSEEEKGKGGRRLREDKGNRQSDLE